MTKTRLPVEKIIWDDAGGFGVEGTTWHSLDEIKEAFASSQFICVSYGVVVLETNKDVCIAQSTAVNDEDHQDEYSNLLRIPKAMIIERIIVDD